MQTSFSSSLTQYTEGQLTQQPTDADVQTRIVDDTNKMSFGRYAMFTDSAQKLVSNLYSNQATWVTSATLVGSDSIACTVYVNGSANVLSTTTYATSHAATMAALAAKIAAISGVASATVSTNTITVAANAATDVYLTSTITNGGAGTGQATVANTCSSVIYGPTVQEELMPDSSGNVYFENGRAVGLLRKGYIALPTAASTTPASTLYAVFHGSDRGKITTSAGSAPTTAIALSGIRCEANISSTLSRFAINNP